MIKVVVEVFQHKVGMMFKKLIVGGALFFGAINIANANIDVTVNNSSTSNISFAFSYLNKDTNSWVVEGWYNVKANENAVISLNTENSLVYLYAESSNGKKIEGGNGSVDLMTKFQSFYYEQTESLANPDMKVRFLRAMAKDNKIKLNIK